MDRLGHFFLPRSRLTGDENGGFAPGHLPNDGEHLLHLFALADDVRFLAFQGLESLQLPRLPLVVEGSHDPHLELRQLEGLLDIVVGSEPHGLHRRLDRAIGGHHQDLDVLIHLLRLSQHLEPIRFGHPHVGDDQVEVLLIEPADCLAPVGGGLGIVAMVAEQSLQILPQGFLVLDDQEALHFPSPCSGSGIQGP